MLVVLIELFSLAVTAEALWANIGKDHGSSRTVFVRQLSVLY